MKIYWDKDDRSIKKQIVEIDVLNVVGRELPGLIRETTAVIFNIGNFIEASSQSSFVCEVKRNIWPKCNREKQYEHKSLASVPIRVKR